MNCNKPSGGEAPDWKVAGTIYNESPTASNSNAIVKLYTSPDGTGILKYKIEVEAKGNLYHFYYRF
jgi:hypothetical protein